MRPPSAPRKVNKKLELEQMVTVSAEDRNLDENGNEMKTTEDHTNVAIQLSPNIIINLDVLSTKMRTSAFTMHKDTKKEKRKMNILNVDKGTPGPGEYNTDLPSQSGTDKTY